ncbi:DNA methyltransferase [Streptomyces sp. WM6373]|nr:DNA methyltransferase [Streptomyces sp. WM6373]KOU57360.1 DNA methyltransferase [Streptomyces sp. IGB124]KOU72855.1 DNA methyltransferase [Streptomyces sp. XY66]KOU85417.1 DNA methyltransferase [Streptomyces sp. XY58]KOV05404.1 DNA methyltransferase [Streptomyces sp. XY37]KOV17388.1 DNA methyltransferase [Streptomyces sp. XY413]KOV28148.1 DNA methyltransferase [Streptomyces sp. H021]KOV45721.1 DNA methyltransferase [Streptomyces sp. MMG1064]
MLDDLMPWAVGGLRLGRDWVASPDPAALRTRWSVLAGAEGAERDRLFRPSRSRTPTASAAALPGQRSAGTARFADAPGPCPDPVRVLREPFDEQWLLPDQRLIDTARPELWRVLDEHQLFLVEAPDPLVTAHLPAGRLGRIRPLHRRPGGAEPNLAPGLLTLLGERHGGWVTPEDVLCWILAAGRPGPRGYEVPLAADPGRWRAGLELGHRMLTVQLRGARGGEAPRLPGGRRPYVRSAVGGWPGGLAYDAETETLALGSGTVSPVPAGAWEYEVQGVRVLESWFAARTAHRGPEADGLAALGPAEWPQSWTSELLALVTTLALLAELAPERAAFEPGPGLPTAELRAAGVLPPPAWSRRPASVLDHQEEGPGGQFALL